MKTDNNPLIPTTRAEQRALLDEFYALPDPELSDDDVLYEGDPGYDEMVNLREASIAAGERPFRDELTKELTALLDALETKVKDTHATPHVRTAAGVRKFRQSIGSVIKRDIIPPTLTVNIGAVDATPQGDAAEKTTKALAAHVQERVIQAVKDAPEDTDPDAALKMLANRELHGPILAKLHATEAGRKWLAEHEVADSPSLEWLFGDKTGPQCRAALRKRLIALDPTSMSRTEDENKKRADKLIAYLRSEDSWLTKEFEKADYEDAKYGEALLRSLVIGTTASPAYGSQWYLTPGDIALVARARDHIESLDPDTATVAIWTRKCIDTWASTAFDTNSLSIAMQATAETLYGGDSLVTRFPHVAEKQTNDQKKLAAKVDALITENAPFLAAFVSTVYERSQETLKALPGDKVRIWRGMKVSADMMKRTDEVPGVATWDDVEEFAKTGWKPWLDHWAATTPIEEQLSVFHDQEYNWGTDKRVLLQEQAFYEWYEQKHGVEPVSMQGNGLGEYDASVVLQPLSATATTPNVAHNFTETYGSGTPDDGISSLFTMDIPKERIWSIPTHGPGCLEEDEVIVLGGEYTAHVKEQTSRYAGSDIHHMIDDKFGGNGTVESAVTENVRDLLKRELRHTKGDERAAANMRMYDLVGRSVSTESEVGIFAGHESWGWYDEIASEMSDLDMRWYYTMRAIGFSKDDAKELATAVNKRKSKQKFSKPKPVAHVPPPVKKAPARKIPGQIGASFMPGRSKFGVHKAAHKVPAKKPWKAAKKLVKKPVIKKAYIDKLPNPETISYDAMVAAVYAENPKYMTVYPPTDGNGASPEQWFHINLFQMAIEFDKQGIKPKTKVTKAFIDKWSKQGIEFDGSQWYIPDTWYPDEDMTKEPKFPAGLEAAMRDRGYVWQSSSMMFVIPYTPGLKKKLPKEMLGKPKVKKPPVKKAVKKAAASAAQKLFDLGVDSKGKPKALNQSYGWHKQPDGSYKCKYKASGPLIKAMEMHGWSYEKWTNTFHPPGLPKKKAAHKKLVPAKKAAKK